MDFIQDFKMETEEIAYVAAPKTGNQQESKIEGDTLQFEVIAGDVDVIVTGLTAIIRGKTIAGAYSVDFSGDADLGPGVFTLKDNVSGNMAAPQAATLGGGVTARTRTDV